MYGELPVWGMYVRHAEGVMMKNITISTKGEDFRTAVIMDDVKNVKMNGITIPKAVLPALILNKVTNPIMENMRLPAEDQKAILKK